MPADEVMGTVLHSSRVSNAYRLACGRSTAHKPYTSSSTSSLELNRCFALLAAVNSLLYSLRSSGSSACKSTNGVKLHTSSAMSCQRMPTATCSIFTCCVSRADAHEEMLCSVTQELSQPCSQGSNCSSRCSPAQVPSSQSARQQRPPGHGASL